MKEQRQLDKKAELVRKAEAEARERRGEGSEERKIRSEANGKENSVLKPYMKKYQNVDENITTVKQRYKNVPY